MGRRTYTYFLLFLAIPANAAFINRQSTIIPPVIVKTAYKVNYSLTSGPITRITRQQMTTAGVTTLAQALQNLGGVQLQDMSGNGSQVLLSMRGFGANAGSNTLLLVNGIPLTNPDMAPPNLNTIPLYEIEYVEIIAGSESVLYGDQAVGGIINIVTREQAKEQTELSCDGGSYNQHRCYIMLHNSYQRLNYNVAVSNYHSDNYREHNDYDQNHLLGYFAYAYQTGRISLNYTIANDDMQYPGALTAPQVRQNRRQSANDTDFFKNWNGFLHFKQKQSLNDDWRIETDLVHNVMQGHGVLFSPFTQSRSTYFIKPSLKGTLNSVLLTAGFDIQDDRYHLNSTFGMTQDSQQKYGIFAMANVPVNSQLSMSLGVRGAQQNSYLRSFLIDNNINRAEATSIGTAYHITPDISLYLRRAESFRFPKADENASAFRPLRTQRGAAYETGAEITRENYSAKIGLYQLNLKDEIAFDPTQSPLTPFGTNRNLDPTLRRGLTLSGKRHITEKITLDGQYNYVNAVFASGANRHNRIPLVSEHIVRADAAYEIAEHWNIYSEVVYTGSEYADNDDANIAGKLGGYTIYNFNIRYEYQPFSMSFRVNNIFNKYYYIYTVYQPMMNSEFFYPAPDRNFMLTLNYAI